MRKIPACALSARGHPSFSRLPTQKALMATLPFLLEAQPLLTTR